MTQTLNDDGTLPYERDARGKPVLLQEVEDWAAGGGGVTNPLTEDLDADGHAITGASNLPTLLTDPGNVWAAETVVAEGYRIAVSGAWVFECDGAGTTDSTEPGSWLLDGNDVTDGTASWVYIGDIGGLPTSTFSTYVGSSMAAGVSAALAEQTVPQTNPSVQDVIDVLVSAFGLVQSD